MTSRRSVPPHLLIVAVVLTILGGACGNSDSAEPDDTTSIVATTTVLGDVARAVVGNSAASVEVLLPIGADPHDYEASARQIASIHEADLVISNGLLLEDGLSEVLATAAADGANVFEVGPLIDPIPFGGEDDHGDDPHFWLDPERVAQAARAIATQLAAVDDEVSWMANADAYAAEVLATDAEIVTILSSIPEGNRKLVANHDSLGYFAARYDFIVIGAVIPGGSTLSDPSSAELSALVEQIQAEGVAAIFAETSDPTALAEAVAAEAGDTVTVVDLYTGSLGEPGSGAETLIGMLLTNARLISEALS